MTTLYVREGSEFRVAESQLILEKADQLISNRFRVGAPVLDHPQRTRQFLRYHLGGREFEIFGLIHLDSRHRLIALEDLFRGTIDGTDVYPREVLKSALQHNSQALILFHNHPSGLPEPSAVDIGITRQLKDALAMVDVRLVDHMVVGETVYSFSEHGLL